MHSVNQSSVGGIHVLSSNNTDVVDNSTIYILSHNMERHCLDAQYASGVLPREVINHSNYERGMKWFSIGVGYGDPVV